MEYVVRLEIVIKADTEEIAKLKAKGLALETFKSNRPHGVYLRPMFGKNEFISWD